MGVAKGKAARPQAGKRASNVTASRPSNASRPVLQGLALINRNTEPVFDAKYDRLMVNEIRKLRNGLGRVSRRMRVASAKSAAKANKLKWNYEKQGRDWPGLCSTGRRQSPININASSVKGRAGLIPQTNYTPSRVNLVNDGRIIGTTGRNLGYIVKGGVRYHVSSLHFHTPAEHQINGKRYPLELQIVHRRKGHRKANSEAVIVSVLYDYGVESGFLTSLRLGLAPRNISVGPLTHRKIDLKQLGLARASMFAYRGSLMPPCSENAWWYVVTKARTASRLQIRSLSSRFPKGNNRAIQAPNGRRVSLLSPTLSKKMRFRENLDESVDKALTSDDGKVLELLDLIKTDDR